jgi:hypothetical protein
MATMARWVAMVMVSGRYKRRTEEVKRNNTTAMPSYRQVAPMSAPRDGPKLPIDLPKLPTCGACAPQVPTLKPLSKPARRRDS